ncbi:hypothetical protein Taro_003431 [Colocasia esculenta]|uniref:Uncharacterized protein n=1 Tax=Colocasia esculenta TaxID=4460 RepID=A0A843TLQ7_COLES|nr:hypothetical protein [Colocasia esculenta]
MNDFRERPKSWSPDSALSETTDKEVSWKNFDSSMNAISFGFVATAILIFMFLIMAIFEHILRPRAPILQSRNGAQASFNVTRQARISSLGKLGPSQSVPDTYPPDFSVLMPGNQYPTYIAQPAPLPCSREGVHWPSHDHQPQHFSQPCTECVP